MSQVMPILKQSSRILRRRLAALVSDRRGVSAVEFALLAPVMITLYLGGVEVSEAISVDRKVTLTARTIADLVSQGGSSQQGSTISNTDMADFLKAATAVTLPYDTSKLKVKVSSVTIDAEKVARVAWSDATSNTTARSKCEVVTLPGSLTSDPASFPSVIWAEVSYDYKPVIGYMITGTMNLTGQSYMRPRQHDKIGRDGVTPCT